MSSSIYYTNLQKEFEKTLGRRLTKPEKELVLEMLRKQWISNKLCK
ncbi:hypothetical protein [Alteribacillus sp. HJP-4]